MDRIKANQKTRPRVIFGGTPGPISKPKHGAFSALHFDLTPKGASKNPSYKGYLYE